MPATQGTIDRRYDFVILYDCEMGNPNGDPDAGNQPRLDPETGHGLVTDVCLKRKVRDFVALTREFKPPFDIYVKHRGILANEQRKAYLATKQEPGDSPNDLAKKWMCENFFDVRTFGAVMSTGKTPDTGDGKKGKQKLWNCGQVRGPVQLTFGKSIDPVLPLEHAITRVALTNPGDTGRVGAEGDEKAATGQFGRKQTLPYGLYRTYGFVSAALAEQTGFGSDDLSLLWEAIRNMFEHDRSAARGLMTTRKLFVFEHEGKLGNAPAHELFDLVKIQKKDGVNSPRQYSDYTIEEPKNLPKGVRLV